MPEPINITREYRDNFSVKEFTETELVPKYFSDIDASLRTVGMIAFTTEQIANISEDVYNSGTVLFRETFPNRAQIPESIYSHAAIFQISNVFSTAAQCTFLLVMEEKAIIKNMIVNETNRSKYDFYIDKDTLIYVEDIPFSIDYDIHMVIYKKTSGGKVEYIFSAQYIMDDPSYENSLSGVTYPYIKVRRSNEGYVALELSCHQAIRRTEVENVLTTNYINYQTIDIDFDGEIAGFEVIYHPPEEDGVTVFPYPLEKLVDYSQPVDDPFCYYSLHDEDTIRISFNTKSDYFIPDYGSQIEVIVYETLGEKGNFTTYNGTDVHIVATDEKWQYQHPYLTAARPVGASIDGRDSLTIDELQSLAVMGYRTANALTSEADLMEFFSNYSTLYNESKVLFLKKRNDIFERVYSAFIVMQKNDYIYNTNTLNLKLNINDMESPEKNVYIIEPGTLFTNATDSSYAQFYRDSSKYETYYAEYLQAVKDGTIPYISDDFDKSELPGYLDRAASYAEFKARKGYEDKLTIFDFKDDYYPLELLDDAAQCKFLYMNPFLIRFVKNPNLLSLYMTYIDQSALLDFVYNGVDNVDIHFIMTALKVVREFEKEKRFHISVKLATTISISDDYPVVQTRDLYDDKGNFVEKEYILNDRFGVKNNDLRVFVMIRDQTRAFDRCCYIELLPEEYDPTSSILTFGRYIYTDDHITSDGKIRILDQRVYRDTKDGTFYEVKPNDPTKYIHYNEGEKDTPIETVSVDTITNLYDNNSGRLEIWDVVNRYSKNKYTSQYDDILIPMVDSICEVHTLYRRHYGEDENGGTGLVIYNDIEAQSLRNDLLVYEEDYDPGFKYYNLTNIYETAANPITFVKPLNGVRSSLAFEDFTAGHVDEDGNYIFDFDIMDADIKSLPFVRWNLIKDADHLDFFMNSFLMQYNALSDIENTRLRNETSIDVKFYNTYGVSRDFRIGEFNENLDTVNISLIFDMWFIPGTDTLSIVPSIKEFIKADVETINEDGMNNLYISNLMRKIEIQFAEVDHIRFRHINQYDTEYQAIRNYVDDLNELSIEERRYYVPELLVINLDDITINEYFVDQKNTILTLNA